MNKKTTGMVVLSALVASIIISSANANMFWITSTTDKMEMVKLLQKSQSWETLTQEEQELLNKIKDNLSWMNLFGNYKKWINWNMKWLTDDEKTALQTMTDDEKTTFFEQKRAEKKAEIEAKKIEREKHEAIIDKLIDGDTLTDEEKVILEEIKTKRAERKIAQQQNEEKMQEIKMIMEKKMNWEVLTEQENKLLEEHRWSWKCWMWGKWWHKWM